MEVERAAPTIGAGKLSPGRVKRSPPQHPHPTGEAADPPMTALFRNLLASLYGDATADALTARVVALADGWRPRLARVNSAGIARLTEREVLLITYADQVQEPGQPPLRTLHRFATQHLPGAVSGMHLLPFYPWSSDDGFAVKDFLAVDPACGTWDDVTRLGEHFDLMFDAVFNHVSVQGVWFRGFLADDPAGRDCFITVTGSPDLSQVIRPRTLPLLTEFLSASGPRRVWTTFGPDQADLNFRNPEVLFRVLDTLLFYVAHGARFLRLDAVAFLWKEPGTPCLHLPQTHRIIQLFRAVLDEVAPQVRLITETNVPHADNLSYFGDGTNEAQLVYNFALPPLVLHSFATGNAEKLTRWAQSLTLPSDRVTFFNFLASHDGIGLNPARGILSEEEIDALVARTLAHGGFISYKDAGGGRRVPYEMNINFLDALSDPAAAEPVELAARKMCTAHAILLSLPGVPGIYFHSLFGSRGDRAGAEASGIPRRINREKLELARLESELADAGSLRARVLAGLRQLLGIRHQHPALAPAAPQRVLAIDPRVFAVLRPSQDGADAVLCLQNVSSEPVPLDLETVGPGGPEWHPLPDSGRGHAPGGRVVIAPYGSSWVALIPGGRNRLLAG